MKKLPLVRVFAVLAFPILYFFSLAAFIFGLTAYLANSGRFNETEEQKTSQVPVYTLFSKVPPVLGAFTSSYNASDARSAIIEQFFAEYRSPLAPYGQKFVEVADKYSLPWELLPAITMQESNGGKKLPNDDCLNPFGWGIHSKSTLCFKTWEEAIDKVADGLKKYYVDQGLTTTKEIMSKYNPTSYKRGGSWGNGVEFFIDKLRNFNTPTDSETFL